MLPLPSDTDLPPAAVAEIASILAKGYVRYRASLRKQLYDPTQEIQARQAQPGSHPPAPPAAPNTGLAFPVLPSVHVTVVNAKRKKTKGEQR
jgi:hypothetical protein